MSPEEAKSLWLTPAEAAHQADIASNRVLPEGLLRRLRQALANGTGCRLTDEEASALRLQLEQRRALLDGNPH